MAVIKVNIDEERVVKARQGDRIICVDAAGRPIHIIDVVRIEQGGQGRGAPRVDLLSVSSSSGGRLGIYEGPDPEGTT